jgi:hypothetical protein
MLDVLCNADGHALMQLCAAVPEALVMVVNLWAVLT